MITWTIDDVEVEGKSISEIARDIVGDYVRCIMKPSKIMIDAGGFGRVLYDYLNRGYPDIPCVGFIKTRAGIHEIGQTCDCGASLTGGKSHECPNRLCE